MSSKKGERTIVTNIEDYLRGNYPALAELFDYCQLTRNLAARPNSAGITLLVPNEAYMKQIYDLSRSSETSDIEKACNTLQSLIITKALHTGKDWDSDDITDMRYPRQQIKVKKSSSSERVELVGPDGAVYATATVDKGFKVGFRSNLAIWKIDGRMRSEMDAAASQPKHKLRSVGKAPASQRTGGYELSTKQAELLRFKIAVIAENEFTVLTSEKVPIPPQLSYLISFARFMYDAHRDIFFSKVLPLIHFRLVDFYIIFESHRIDESNQYLIPDECIEEWWTRHKFDTSESVPLFRKWIDERLKEGASHIPCAIYNHVADSEIIDQIDNVRVALTPSLQNVVSMPDKIYSVYDEFVKTNRIGDIDNVLPEELIAYYRAHPHFKLAHDELAYIIEPLVINFTTTRDTKHIREVFNIIGNTLHSNTIEEIERTMPLTNKKRIALLMQTQNDTLANEVRSFINSTMFLWIPMTTEMIEKYPIENQSKRPTDTDVIYNVDLALALHHKRIYGDIDTANGAQNDAAILALSKVQPEHISPELRAKIQSMLQK